MVSCSKRNNKPHYSTAIFQNLVTLSTLYGSCHICIVWKTRNNLTWNRCSCRKKNDLSTCNKIGRILKSPSYKLTHWPSHLDLDCDLDLIWPWLDFDLDLTLTWLDFDLDLTLTLTLTWLWSDFGLNQTMILLWFWLLFWLWLWLWPWLWPWLEWDLTSTLTLSWPWRVWPCPWHDRLYLTLILTWSWPWLDIGLIWFDLDLTLTSIWPWLDLNSRNRGGCLLIMYKQWWDYHGSNTKSSRGHNSFNKQTTRGENPSSLTVLNSVLAPKQNKHT